MLYGKIINLEFDIDSWLLYIAGRKYRFERFSQILEYLVWVTKNAKDQNKKELLKQDIRKLIK